MNVLVKKMSKLGILKFEFAIGALVMAAAAICLPVGIMFADITLLANPYVLGVVLITMLLFGLLAYFLFMRPYFIYRKSPEVLVKTDGEYLYIYGNQQAKIPLSAFEGAVVTFQLPFIYSNEFVAVLLVHLFSEKYGDLDLDIPGYGSYKLRFVSDVYATANALTAFINQAINNN